MFKVGDKLVYLNTFRKSRKCEVIALNPNTSGVTVMWEGSDYFSHFYPYDFEFLVHEEIYNSPLYKLLQEEK